jgi:hypothetical protein
VFLVLIFVSELFGNIVFSTSVLDKGVRRKHESFCYTIWKEEGVSEARLYFVNPDSDHVHIVVRLIGATSADIRSVGVRFKRETGEVDIAQPG